MAVRNAAVLVVLCAGTACGHRDQDVKFATPYQAVLLSNGMMYFGQLEGYGSPNPVLTNVYYIVTQTNGHQTSQ
jgi:hypothetical protein